MELTNESDLTDNIKDILQLRQDSTPSKYEKLETLAICISHKVNALKRKKYKKKWLTNDDIRDLLGVNDRLIKKYRDSGFLKYSQEGKKYWYSREDIEFFLNKTHYYFPRK